MDLTVEQVLALARDASASTAGKKLGNAGSWQRTGRSERALWGECQGSALYQVRVDLADLTVRCSCPSRKFPCKHGLGLLVLAASSPAAVPEGEPPDWVSEWLAKRAQSAERRESGKASQPDETAGEEAPRPSAGTATTAKRADRRLARVAAGLDGLDLWLNDLVRNGLASVETQPATFWERQAARLVDAQAPGLAGRVRRLAALPNASRDWPRRLLDQLGRLTLLTDAFRRLDELDPALQEDVRGAIGWALGQEEVAARGEAVADEWLVLGQRVTVEDKLRAQWTWLLGADTGRYALVLQYAAAGARFETLLLPGVRQAAELVYWPSASPQRALIRQRHGAPTPLTGPLPGAPSLAAFLDGVAEATARRPWLERFPCALRGVVPLHGEGSGWLVRDGEGMAVPLAPGEHWRLLALSGGAPVDLAGEWDGEALLPLGVLADGAYHLLREGA